MNKRQKQAYNELMDYVARQEKNYKELMRHEKGGFAFFPKFEVCSREKVLDFDAALEQKTKQVIKDNLISRKEVKELEGFLKRSSIHVTKSGLLDLYLPQLLSALGTFFLLLLFYVLFFDTCAESLGAIDKEACMKKSSLALAVVTYIVGSIIAFFIALAVKRRAMLMLISSNKSILAEHVSEIAGSLPKRFNK